MKSIVNPQPLRRGRFIATATSIAGFILLLASTIATLVPNFITFGYPILLTGIVLSFIGLRFANAWVRAPLPHDALEHALKGSGKDVTLLSYWRPAKHILMTPGRIYTVAVRTQPFSLTIDGDTWRDHEPWLRRQYHALMQSGLGQPMAEAERDCTRLDNFLRKHMPNSSAPISPLVVFTHANTNLEVINQPSTPVVYAGKRKPSLKTHLRQPADATLPPAQIAQLEELVQTVKCSPIPGWADQAATGLQ